MFDFSEEELTAVKIDRQEIQRFVKENLEDFRKFRSSPAPIDRSLKTINEKLIFFILFDSINFCFWSNPEWYIVVKGNKVFRSKAIEILLVEEHKRNERFLNSEFLSEITFNTFNNIFRINGVIQLMEERWKSVTSTFQTIQRDFNGEPLEILKQSKNDAYQLSLLISDKFKSFNDNVIYKGKLLRFNKRAQLLASKIADLGIIKFKNTDKLVAFADYRLPQLLRHLKIIRYSSELADVVDQKMNIEQGSKEEVEIRAGTILALEIIKEEINRSDIKVETRQIDSYLWNKAKSIDSAMNPHHQTVGIYY